MLHLASAQFYREISQDLERFQYVLHEGATWRKYSRKGSLYDWAATNLGLVTQRNSLKYPDHCIRINIDLPGEEFRDGFKRLPLRYKLLMTFLRPLLWAATVVPATREYLSANSTVSEAREDEGNETALKDLILNQRDDHICRELEEFVEANSCTPNTTFVAVIFGAKHMVAISRCLRGLGYHPTTRRWFDMI
jgi:hypothetical protein